MHQIQEDRENISALALRVRDAIKRQGYIRLSGIKCDTKDSTVFLDGKLSTYYLKQVASSIASKVPGVEKVVDRTKVIG